MSIFGNILAKIFPAGHRASTPAPTASPDATPPSGAASSGTTSPAATAGSTAASAGAATPASPAAPAMPAVDVEQVLNGMAQKQSQTLNWRTSIVDLMKLLDLDSSLTARKQLATELHYSGDTNDSATMNVWLHKQVMTKLAENGGKVPDELKH